MLTEVVIPDTTFMVLSHSPAFRNQQFVFEGGCLAARTLTAFPPSGDGRLQFEDVVGVSFFPREVLVGRFRSEVGRNVFNLLILSGY